MNTETNQYPKLTKSLRQAEVSFPEVLPNKFARVLLQIEANWGNKEGEKYLDSLILGDREDRKGFPLEAIREIVSLKQAHDFLFPSLDISQFDPFAASRTIAPAKGAIVSDATNSLEFTPPIRAKASAEPDTSSSRVITPAPAAKTANQSAARHVNWPKVHTQHELLEYAELLEKNNKHIYELQGKSLGEILMHYKLVDEHSMKLVHNMQNRPQHPGKAIGQIMVEIGIISNEELAYALCIQSGIIMVDVLTLPINSETMKCIPIETARSKQVLPVGTYHNTLFLAVADPFAFHDEAFFTMLTGLKLSLVYAQRHEIISRLNQHGFTRSTHDAQEEFHNLASKTLDFPKINPEFHEPIRDEISENDSAIINLVNQMILNAIEQEASDIHIELFQGAAESGIRFRRDGRLEPFSTFPCAYHNAVISRIKIMSNLDISERRHPQDGKISFPLKSGLRVELRVATIPTMLGREFVTIRILPSGEPLPLSDLGMAERDLTVFREVFQRPYGLILVCGPTGSGKTTTLHSVLKELNTDDRKIWTAEDPVEIVQPHLCQVQINPKIGLTFADMLRAFLRADPDIIMIGEMRDQETAKIALEASMTGHLVLSTLHTNSASETVARMLDLGIDPYNLSDALLAILAQRLARKLCTACAKQEEASAHELEDITNEYYQSAHSNLPSFAERETLVQQWRDRFGHDGKLYLRHAVGCKLCNGGYKGRIGLYELLQATPALRHLIRQHSAAPVYLDAGIADGMRTLKQDGIEKVLRGVTDMIQVRSACI